MAVFIPGLGVGGNFGSRNVDPRILVSSGSIVSIPAARLLNESGVLLQKNKLDSMPAGWKDTTSYKEDYQPTSQTITRTFNGPWSGRVEFAQWALGYSTNAANGSAGKLRRTIPAQHP